MVVSREKHLRLANIGGGAMLVKAKPAWARRQCFRMHSDCAGDCGVVGCRAITRFVANNSN